jgi:hypothetical protein
MEPARLSISEANIASFRDSVGHDRIKPIMLVIDPGVRISDGELPELQATK